MSPTRLRRHREEWKRKEEEEERQWIEAMEAAAKEAEEKLEKGTAASSR